MFGSELRISERDPRIQNEYKTIFPIKSYQPIRDIARQTEPAQGTGLRLVHNLTGQMGAGCRQYVLARILVDSSCRSFAHDAISYPILRILRNSTSHPLLLFVVDTTVVLFEFVPAAYTTSRFSLLVPCPLPRNLFGLWIDDTYATTLEGWLTSLLYHMILSRHFKAAATVILVVLTPRNVSTHTALK